MVEAVMATEAVAAVAMVEAVMAVAVAVAVVATATTTVETVIVAEIADEAMVEAEFQQNKGLETIMTTTVNFNQED
jgi:hypothetical protein